MRNRDDFSIPLGEDKYILQNNVEHKQFEYKIAQIKKKNQLLS